MNSTAQETIIALLHGPDRPGLVARVSGWIFEQGGNILHADQHQDFEEGVFFQRVEWEPAPTGSTATAGEFQALANSLGMSCRVARRGQRRRVAILVSKFDHCFHDLILRWKAGEYPCEIVAIVSNHPDLAELSRGYGIPYHHIPVTSATKPAAETRLHSLLTELQVELVVLARYMQVLSENFLDSWSQPIINIHHSFLPAFAGGKPYHQAHERGVKLIGATAHYVTPVLDDGPIIHQDVIRVSHRHNVADLVRKGRDLEKAVLARAVAWHLENRILVYNNKTVVFD